MPSTPRKPNILLIFTDQQRRDTIGAAGTSWIKTPNLDRLVREGCWYPRATSPCPVCIPARHILLTGHHCETTGYYGNVHGPMARPGVPVYPQLLSDAEYVVGSVGKQHFWPETRSHGFHHYRRQPELPQRRADSDYLLWLAQEGLGHIRYAQGMTPVIYHLPQRAVLDDAHSPVTWVGDESLAFIEAQHHRSWFLMASFTQPHPPWAIPDAWAHLYDGVEVPTSVPPCRSAPWPTAPTPWFGDDDSPEVRRAEWIAYATQISMVDHQVGRLIAELERQGILDDTVIIFTSDHGEMLGDRGFYQKSLPWEPSVGIPLIVRAPGRVAAGSIETRAVDLADLFPTFLDVAQHDYAPYSAGGQYRLIGDSLFRLEASARDRTRQWANYGVGAKRWIMLRDDRHKYIFWYNGGTEEFYDLVADPQETRNLVGTAALPADRFAALRAACFAEEQLRAPAGMCVDGVPQALPLTPIPEHTWEGSKYPAWINHQFQFFASSRPNEGILAEVSDRFEAERFRLEQAQAIAGSPLMARVFQPERLNSVYRQFHGYLVHGAEEAPQPGIACE